MDAIYQAVKNVIIFLMLVTVLSNLMGNSSYKKYVNIFVGLVLILIVIKPVLEIINSSSKMDHYYNQNVYKFSASDMSEQLVNADSDYQKQILTEYKKTISSQVEEQLENYDIEITKVDVSIDEDLESDECGAVKSINIEGKKSADKDGTEEGGSDNTLDIDEIDRVTIDKVEINKEENISKETGTEESDSFDTVEELGIKEDLSAFFGLTLDAVKVSITE